MRKLRRLVSVVLVGVMVISMMACGPGKTDGKGKVITLDVYSQTANYNGEMTGWFAQVLLEKFNVKINIIPDADSVYDTRMEAGNLGDIVIWGTDGEKYLNAVEAGLLFDWNEDDLLKTNGAYINEHMQPALEKNKSINPDGKLHGFGHSVATTSEDHDAFFYTWDIRWDLYKQLGYPEVKDLTGLKNVLKDMQALSPTDDSGKPTYALSLWPDWDGSMVMYVKSMASAYYGYDELGFGLYDTDNGKYYDFSEKDGPYLEMLKFFNDLYREGLIDPDSMTQTYDEMDVKVKNGGTLFSIFNYAGSDAYNTEEHLAAGKMMASLIPTEATPIVYGMNTAGSNRIWSIGAKTQYPELCMDIINWIATPEGTLTNLYGPKGVCWDYDAEGGTVFTELGLACKNDKTTMVPESTGYYTKQFKDGTNQMNNLVWASYAINPESKKDERYDSSTWVSNQTPAKHEIDQDWRTWSGYEERQPYMDSKPYKLAVGTSYAESTKSAELKVVWDQVKKAVVDYSWRAIYAESDDAYNKIVDEMISQVMSYGYDDVREWCEKEAATRWALEEAVRGNK